MKFVDTMPDYSNEIRIVEESRKLLSQVCPEGKGYVYLALMRPPMPGAVPRAGLIHCDCEEGIAPSGHHYWGRAVYDRELTEKEVYDYELEKA